METIDDYAGGTNAIVAEIDYPALYHDGVPLRNGLNGIMDDYIGVIAKRIYLDPDTKLQIPKRRERKRYSRELASKKINWLLETHGFLIAQRGEDGDLLVTPEESCSTAPRRFQEFVQGLDKLLMPSSRCFGFHPSHWLLEMRASLEGQKLME